MQGESCGSPFASQEPGFCAGLGGRQPEGRLPPRPLACAGELAPGQPRAQPGRGGRARGPGEAAEAARGLPRPAALPPQPSTRPSRHPPLPWKPAAAPAAGWGGAGRRAAPQGPEGPEPGSGDRRCEGGSLRGRALWGAGLGRAGSPAGWGASSTEGPAGCRGAPPAALCSPPV